MGEPRNFDKTFYIHELLEGLQSELMSASSSLYMDPEPLKDRGPEATFLSETDYWANHSLQHIRAAIQAIGKIRRKITDMQTWLLLHGMLPNEEE